MERVGRCTTAQENIYGSVCVQKPVRKSQELLEDCAYQDGLVDEEEGLYSVDEPRTDQDGVMLTRGAECSNTELASCTQ